MKEQPDYQIRELAFLALRQIYHRGAYSDIALERVLNSRDLSPKAKNLVCELVYGVVRRQRYLDALIDQLGQKKAQQQPPDLRIILHLGLYQLCYLEKIIGAIAVSSSVELAKKFGLTGLSGVVNGLLRSYQRSHNPLVLPDDPVQRLGILHSFPDWIVANWLDVLGLEETTQLCQWFNQSPSLDLRVNILKTSVDKMATILIEQGLAVTKLETVPQGLRINGPRGSIQQLPGYDQGWWVVQDSSAQLVTHLLDPQPGEKIIDACAAPGGKTTHIAELMGDVGEVWAIDRSFKRLKKVQENLDRLQLNSISLHHLDSSTSELPQECDRVLVDAPCSGNGTLHKRPDLRWRQTPEEIPNLVALQRQILNQAATWVKPGGKLVYATCTLNPPENEDIIQSFLANHSQWSILPPSPDSFLSLFVTPEGWIKIWPHRQQMDGFFMVRLEKCYHSSV
ncbi:16S rRNA (cytosine(967)-C(5))-methyltransferase [Gloeocapsa sp. PCC 73106]|uniref:16S rRNA (cytosine(967)-C(5))-methyltransferase n=1 Tax=Gloeocapsa sp. PCC 73106 TaxID=102232 RepID=UPI0002AC308D|nr:16S rRNA (cytosine(967)-C(5))-methyltransferase [Gloeocapsa sp. PCC 73106]ELR96953.1 ribosomal RNA small subunit methyltransferase RsmB [Gloeocapsa sp. PCC 73106]